MKTILINQYSQLDGTGSKVVIKDPVIHTAGSIRQYAHRLAVYDLIHKWLRIGRHILKIEEVKIKI